MDHFPWLGLFLLVFLALGLGLWMNQFHQWLATYRFNVGDDDGVISREAVAMIDVALVHWRQVRRRDDEHWDAAFASLGEAFANAAYLDVRLYMYARSNEAASLFRAYECGIYD